MRIKRYEILLANLDPTLGSEINKTRPVVVIIDDAMNKTLNTLVVCPLTTKLHPMWRSRVQVVCAKKDAEIAIDQIRTISKNRLIKKIDKLTAQDSALVRQVITEMYGE